MRPKPTAVLLGGTDPFARIGGHETLVLAYAEAATRAGFDTHMFYVSPGRTPPPIVAAWTPHPIRSPVRPLRGLMASAHAPFLARAIERFITQTPGPITVHAFGAWATVAAVVARRAGRHIAPIASAYTTLDHEMRSKLASISGDHSARDRLRALLEYGWVGAVARRAERRAYAAMSLVLVNYDSVRALLHTDDALTVPIRRVPYASLSAFAEADAGGGAGTPRGSAVPDAVMHLLPREAPLIVAVSRQDPRKGVDRLVRALAMLRAADISFRACLAGTGPLLDAHRALAARLGITSSTAIPGRVEDASAYLRAADVFVLPSLEEGSGSLSLLEAMQAGCAIVATRIDGIPEDVTDGEDGLLVAPDDPGALRDALARLLSDAPLRARLGAAARETFERRFSADTLVASVHAVYTEFAR